MQGMFSSGLDEKHWQLKGKEGVALMRAYKAELQEIEAELKALSQEFQSRAQVNQAKRFARLQEMWRAMTSFVGLDASIEFLDKNYSIECRYLDSGFAAIIHTPQKDTVFGEFMTEDLSNDELNQPSPKIDPSKLN